MKKQYVKWADETTRAKAQEIVNKSVIDYPRAIFTIKKVGEKYVVYVSNYAI